MNTNLITTVILLVEDDPGDQKLIKQALAGKKLVEELYIVESGEEALEYLQRAKAGSAGTARPNLIMLDLNMPGMGGKEFLRRIKADDDLRTIPVVVISASGSEADIQECYKLHAAGYVQKAASVAELQKVVGKLVKYWFATVSLVKS